MVEDNRIIVFSFGRMNPPTIGHEKLLDAMAKTAGKNPYRMYLSHSQDNKTNPLVYKDKLKTARTMFPRHARNILKSKKGKLKVSLFQPLTILEIEASHKNKGNLERIKEAKVYYSYQTLHTQIIKKLY